MLGFSFFIFLAIARSGGDRVSKTYIIYIYLTAYCRDFLLDLLSPIFTRAARQCDPEVAFVRLRAGLLRRTARQAVSRRG